MQYAKIKNASNQIVFWGSMRHSQLASLLSKAKGFMCCTKQELNMISITEALACGTPVLTNCVPYQHELITSQSLGIAKNNWDENDIAQLLKNNNEYIDNCRKISTSLSNDFLAESMISIFNRIRS